MEWNKNIIIGSALLTIFIVLGLLAPLYPYREAEEENARQVKSQGIDIEDVQKSLKSLGYYRNDINGIYDYKTYWAVRMFQRDKGLKSDGVIRKKTAEELGILLVEKEAEEDIKANQGDIHLLARAVHGEARGEPYVGKVAVAAVILNRVNDSKFPNTIAGVIYQPGAFTAVSDGQMNLTPDQESIRAARDAMNGWDPSDGALYYYNPAKATSRWIWSREVYLIIGDHHFAK